MRKRRPLVFILLPWRGFQHNVLSEAVSRGEGAIRTRPAVNSKLPYWEEAEAGLRRCRTADGESKPKLVGPEKFDPQEEMRAFQKNCQRKPRGHFDFGLQTRPLSRCNQCGGYKRNSVITVDADAPDSKRVLFIGTDNFRAGQESGNEWRKF